MPVTVHPRVRLIWSWIGLSLSLLIPSTAVFQKYFGMEGVAAYLIVASTVLFLLSRYRRELLALAAKVTEKQALWLVGLTFFIVVLAFFVVYPVADSGAAGGGSDSDDALNVATQELLHGRYPYYPRTYLGNPISPLPGALFLAVPFVLLGNCAYQNFFWLLVFVIAMKSYFRDGRLALLLLWVILALSPIVLYQPLTGSDYISNSLYVLLFMLWTAVSIPRPDIRSWQKVLPAIWLGVGLSSRPNFLLVMPLLFSVLVQKAGWKQAIKYTVITFITWIVVTIPFYLWDPQYFSPLQTIHELDPFQSIIPFAVFVIPLVSGMLAVLMAAFQSASHDLNILLRNSTVVLAFPVVCGIILAPIKSGKIDLGFAFFGTFFLFFGASAFWKNLCEPIV